MNNHFPVQEEKFLKSLIVIAIIVLAFGLLFPITTASYSAYYGSIAKHIAVSNNWSDLMLSNQDWLDKPHFPFWITAASFKIFGVNSFAYILPGFLFNLLGAYYTYRLTLYLYHNTNLALLSTVIYLTIFHLMISSIDVRAEAYLLGELMPAVYYWLNYDRKFSLKFLLLGAIFTGLALMTKGIFVIITIISGLLCLWAYEKRLINIILPKWWLALGLSLVFAIPELIALYLQFDLHPEKVIFGHTHVSGIRWFFIDSQFGRFFGTGPIMTTNPMPYHQLFFLHTFLWAFLPWSFIYPLAIYFSIRYFKQQSVNERNNTVLLLGYFWISFIMFSITSFQVDHYTNIIFPFAAIMCAKLLYDLRETRHKLFIFQQGIAILMLVLIGILIGLLFKGWILIGFVLLEIIAVLVFVRFWGQTPFIKTILLPFSVICLVYMFAMTANGYLYHQYDSGSIAAEITNRNPELPVVDYQLDSRGLEFYAQGHYYKADKLSDIPNLPQYYLVMPDKLWQSESHPQGQIIGQVKGNVDAKIIPHLANPRELNDNLNTYDIILVKN